MSSAFQDAHWVLKWGGLCGLFPFYSASTGKFARRLGYTAATGTAFLFFAVCTNLGRFLNLGATLRIDEMPSILNSLASAHLSVGLATWNYKRIQATFDGLNRIDRVLRGIYRLKIPAVRGVLVRLGVIHVAVLVISCYDMLTQNWLTFVYLLSSICQYYFMFGIVLLEVVILSSIGNRLRLLNVVLSELSRHKVGDSAGIDVLLKLQLLAFGLAENFNELFGVHLFLTYAQIIARLLGAIENYLFVTYELEGAILSIFWNMFIAMHVDAMTIWGGYLALLPLYNRKRATFTASKIYSLTIAIFLIAMFVYACVGKERLGLFRESDAIILKYVPTIGNIFSNLLIIYSSATWNLKNTRTLYHHFRIFDAVALTEYRVKVPKIKHLHLQFLLVHIYLILIFAYDLYDTNKNDALWTYKYYLNDVLQFYLLSIVVFFQYSVLRNIRARYWTLNRILAGLNVEVLEIYKVEEASCYGSRIDKIIKLHDRLSDLAELFNEMFGLHVLLAMLQIVIKFVSMIHSILAAGDGWEGIFIIVIWNAYIIAQGVVVATKCEQVTNEGKRTITMAYKALHRYSNNQQLQEKLFILTQQATARCPVFTAAGFFNVDFSMLFTFVNLITTYVIVIIQFSSSK